jgi:hypothetical protein
MNIDQFTVFNANNMFVFMDDKGKKTIRQSNYEQLVYSSSVRAVLDVYLKYGNWVPISQDLLAQMPYCFHTLAVCSENLWHPSQDEKRRTPSYGNTHLAIRLLLIMVVAKPELIKTNTTQMEGAVWKNGGYAGDKGALDDIDRAHLDYAGYTWDGLSRLNHLDCKFEFHREFVKAGNQAAEMEDESPFLHPMSLVEAISFLFSREDVKLTSHAEKRYSIDASSRKCGELDSSLHALLTSGYLNKMFATKSETPLLEYNLTDERKTEEATNLIDSQKSTMTKHDLILLKYNAELCASSKVDYNPSLCLTRKNMEQLSLLDKPEPKAMETETEEVAFIWETVPTDYDLFFFVIPDDKIDQNIKPEDKSSVKLVKKGKGKRSQGDPKHNNKEMSKFYNIPLIIKRGKDGNFSNEIENEAKLELDRNQLASQMMISLLVQFLQFKFPKYTKNSFLNKRHELIEIYKEQLEEAVKKNNKVPHLATLLYTNHISTVFHEIYPLVTIPVPPDGEEATLNLPGIFAKMCNKLIEMAYSEHLRPSLHLMKDPIQDTRGNLLKSEAPSDSGTSETNPNVDRAPAATNLEDTDGKLCYRMFCML